MAGVSRKRGADARRAAAASDVRPFLKWAGGKGQLLDRLAGYFPKALLDGTLHTYCEPFLGGGAMFFHVMQRFPHLRSAFLMDVNEELVMTYKVVQTDVESLIRRLGEMARSFLKLDEEDRKERFLKVRASFNRKKSLVNFRKYASDAWVKRASQLLFLNKTCYNGLFRVNRTGGFNVPFGRYANPPIVNPENLRRAASLLRKASIRLGDFGDLRLASSPVKPGTFVYFDPPYLPISKTASFTAYSQGAFGEAEQKRLATVFRELHRPGVYQMLSNSDPKNEDPGNDFFEDLYSDFRDTLYRVPASRMINSDPARRGKINEIVITSYRP